MLTALTPHPKAQQLKNAVLDASLERFLLKPATWMATQLNLHGKEEDWQPEASN
jgi:hypothetical protein